MGPLSQWRCTHLPGHQPSEQRKHLIKNCLIIHSVITCLITLIRPQYLIGMVFSDSLYGRLETPWTSHHTHSNSKEVLLTLPKLNYKKIQSI